LERGYQVRIIDNLEPQTHPNGKPSWIPDAAEFVHADVRDRDALGQVLNGVDVVYHQAAFGGFTEEMGYYIDANATGTARIYEVIRKHNFPVKKVVFASSQAIFGEGLYRQASGATIQPEMRTLEQLDRSQWEWQDPATGDDMDPVPCPESLSPNGETPYALSKYFEERIGLAFGKTLGIPSIALRYAVTYGPRQSLYNPYTGVISIFSNRVLNGLSPVVYEDGNQTRDFSYVKDIAAANLFLMEHPDAGDEVFNVGTGVGTKMVDLARLIAKVYGSDIEPTLTGEYRPGDVRHFVHDSSKLRSLGWQPQYTLEEGLGEFGEWITSQERVADSWDAAAEGLRQTGVIRKPQGS
jgi:dTDP-L-rhamnose 4-epimerase